MKSKEQTMYYVGIDIAKRTHVAVIMNEDNSLLVQQLQLWNAYQYLFCDYRTKQFKFS